MIRRMLAEPPLGAARVLCSVIANTTQNNQSASQDRLIMPDGCPDLPIALCRACSGPTDRSPVSEAARPPHAGPHRQVLQLKMPLRADQCVAWSSFSASNCPVLGHRVNGGPAGRRKRPVTPSIDLVAAHEGLAPVRKTKTDREDHSARPYFRARRDGGILRSRDNAT